MESCQSCSGTYHEKCKPNISNGCPNCSLQATDINSIVGANFFGSPSSYEIIKRYSVTGIDASGNYYYGGFYLFCLTLNHTKGSKSPQLIF